ncbi:MAG: type I restriction enzyme HsdR N-terminal domain-containing protein [Methanobrevibacter sp.]|nr:type I restriction enzyme HsdR N-terminal domain-containing protein [Methanobrevibacter sp.]
MDLEEEINKFIETMPEKIEYIDTEETTKISLITPMLRILGYDTADPRIVKAEYIADIGTKKAEKVDIAIFKDGEPTILIECKSVKDKLRKDHISQLYRYYNVTSAKFGVLTNGVEYMFFTDSNNNGQMDNDPFLHIDLLDASKKDIKELARFSHDTYDQNKLYSSVELLKYTTLTQEYLENQISQPDDEFARVIGKSVHKGALHSKRLDIFKKIIPDVFKSIIDDKVDKRLQKAIKETDIEIKTIKENNSIEQVSNHYKLCDSFDISKIGSARKYCIKAAKYVIENDFSDCKKLLEIPRTKDVITPTNFLVSKDCNVREDYVEKIAVGNEIWYLFLNLARDDILDNAINILKKFSYSDDRIKQILTLD